MKKLISSSKLGLKKGTWSPEEDQKLIAYIKRYGIWNWTLMPIAAGLSRSGKSCRLRWMNYLKPELKRERLSFQEIETIIKLHQSLGNKWSKIAENLPGRTDNEIKNFWNTHMRKRFTSSSNGVAVAESSPENHRGGRPPKGIEHNKAKRASAEEETSCPEFPIIAESYSSPTIEDSSRASIESDSNNISSSSSTSFETTHYPSSSQIIQAEDLMNWNASDVQLNDEEPDWEFLAHELSSAIQEDPTCDSINNNNNNAMLSFWFNVFVDAHKVELLFRD